jgi:hypothetical protein
MVWALEYIELVEFDTWFSVRDRTEIQRTTKDHYYGEIQAGFRWTPWILEGRGGRRGGAGCTG